MIYSVLFVKRKVLNWPCVLVFSSSIAQQRSSSGKLEIT